MLDAIAQVAKLNNKLANDFRVLSSSVSSLNLDWNTAKKFYIELTQDVTITFINPVSDGELLQLYVIQDNVGGHSLTLNATIKWAYGAFPELSSAPSAGMVINLLYIDSEYYGNVIQI